MKCDQAIDLLLEADLAELSRDGESAVSHHLAQCERCRADAGRILDQHREMAEALRVEPRVPVDVALAVVRRRARPARRVRSLRWMAPLAAAAAIAVMIVSGNGNPRFPDVQPSVARAPSVTLDLGIAADANVAVFESATRPDVVVVWFY